MKITIHTFLFALLLLSCKKEDDGGINTPPEAFALLTVENKEEEASLHPTFTWQPATDIDGDAVVYDLYLEIRSSTETLPTLNANAVPPDPTSIRAQGITETSFTIVDALPLNTSFTWKIVARDNKGGSAESEIFQFSTRLLNFDVEALTTAPFDVREGHGSVFFKNKFWVIGGFANIEDIKNDVWSSSDGITWSEETANAGFNSRGQFGITVFRDRIFIVGGLGNSTLLEDVWSSGDGVNWVQENANPGFSPRVQTKLVSLNDKLYAIGGLENPFDTTTGSTEEVWSSTNGADWVLETDSAPYMARFGFEALAFDNKIFVIGGALGATFEEQADVWYSDNGKDWTQAAPSGVFRFKKRVFLNSTVFKNKIWLTGGSFEDALGEVHYTDFWSSSNGTTWKREALDAGYEARFSPTLVSNQDYMLLIGGGQIGTNNKFNDIWKFN